MAEAGTSCFDPNDNVESAITRKPKQVQNETGTTANTSGTCCTNSNEWTVVSSNGKGKKKKQFKNSIRNESSTYGNNSISSGIKNSITNNNGVYVDDINALYDVLERCINDIQRTDFYKRTIAIWENDMGIGNSVNNSSNFDEQILSSISLANNSNQVPNSGAEKEDAETTIPSRRRIVHEIVCYGIGNFSKTSLVHYSPSLIQLAYAICIQRRQCTSSVNLTGTNNVEEEEGNITSCIASCRSNSTCRPRIVYYDPCMTPLEGMLLQTKLLNCSVLTTNERGNHPSLRRNTNNTAALNNTNNNTTARESVTTDAAEPTAKDPSLPQQRYVTIFFMIHCPAALYENVVWSNWNNIVGMKAETTKTAETILTTTNSSETASDISNDNNNNVGKHADLIDIVIVGNSLKELAERTFPVNSDDVSRTTKRNRRKFLNKNDMTNHRKRRNYKFPTLQTLGQWLLEFPLEPCITKHDTQTMPGEINSAFNDTYISQYNYDGQNIHDGECALAPFLTTTRRINRPYETTDDAMNNYHYVDPELF